MEINSGEGVAVTKTLVRHSWNPVPRSRAPVERTNCTPRLRGSGWLDTTPRRLTGELPATRSNEEGCSVASTLRSPKSSTMPRKAGQGYYLRTIARSSRVVAATRKRRSDRRDTSAQVPMRSPPIQAATRESSFIGRLFLNDSCSGWGFTYIMGVVLVRERRSRPRRSGLESPQRW